MKDKYTISLPVINKHLSNNGIYDIKTDTPDELRTALEQFARYFKNEFRYDHIQYEANEHHYTHVQYHGFVFTDSALDAMTNKHTETPTRLLGGCCFRNREFKEGTQWVLDWIWIHPFVRNKGILTKHWKHFEDLFGINFLVEPPYSKSMQEFLNKIRNT